MYASIASIVLRQHHGHHDLESDTLWEPPQTAADTGLVEMIASPQRFASVVDRIGPTGLSRRQAAKELAIGYATLKRLLDARHRTQANVLDTVICLPF